MREAFDEGHDDKPATLGRQQFKATMQRTAFGARHQRVQWIRPLVGLFLSGSCPSTSRPRLRNRSNAR